MRRWLIVGAAAAAGVAAVAAGLVVAAYWIITEGDELMCDTDWDDDADDLVAGATA